MTEPATPEWIAANPEEAAKWINNLLELLVRERQRANGLAEVIEKKWVDDPK